jgi:hypothetical protein
MDLLALFFNRRKRPDALELEPEIVTEVPEDQGASIQVRNSQNVAIVSNANLVVVWRDRGEEMP